MSTIFRRLPALVVVAAMAWTTGCGIETQVTGITADADLADPTLMPVLAHGANLEYSHVWWSMVGYSSWDHLNMNATDEQTNGYANSTSRRAAVNQFHRRQDWTYSQTNEAGWVAAYAAERMYDVNVAFDEDPDTDPLIAHMYIMAGLNMQALAESHCVACVGWGPEGGNLLSGPNPYDAANVVDSDSIMQTAITWAEKAQPVAQAAVAAGRTVEEEPDWEHFIPQNSVYASYALQAIGHMWLENYELADQFAAMVPLDWEYHLYSHWDNSWSNLVPYYTSRYALQTTWGSAIATTFRDVDDPRIPWVVCGEYKEGLTVGGRNRTSDEYDRFTDNPGCSTSNPQADWSARYRTYDGDLPNYLQLKYTSYDDEKVLLSGEEMKLLRAEIALRTSGDLGAFTTYINDVRSLYPGLDPIPTPASVGTMEYPNAEDDAMSILDRESLFTLWLEGRRFSNFRRWQHPFWTGGFYKTPDEENDNNGFDRPKYRRADGSLDYCLPLPDDEECNINAAVRNTEWCNTLYIPGEGPGGQ